MIITEAIKSLSLNIKLMINNLNHHNTNILYATNTNQLILKIITKNNMLFKEHLKAIILPI